MLGLAFSGGKDSLACWYLYRKQNPIIFWVNTGKIYPETLELVNKIKSEAVEFVEIKTNQAQNLLDYGLPSDIVPVQHSLEGMIFSGEKSVKVQSYNNCCWVNISKPLMDAVKKRGITELIRGQRLDEGHKSTAVHGSIVDGIKYMVLK